MSTIIQKPTCQKLVTKCLSGTLYEPKEDTDVLISKLNARITKLEQQEKDYDLLNQEFKQLENDYTLLNEAKLRLEYELKQRNETYNKRICDLKGEKENLQNGLNDKMCVNKKLFEEKQCLENQLNRKNAEIDDLNNQLNSANNRLNSTQNDNDDLQNNLRNLNDIKDKQRDKIAELVDDNKKLAKLCQEQDHSLYLADQEKQKLGKKISDDNANISNLNSKLRAHGNNLNNLQKQLDNSNVLNLQLQKNAKNLDDTLTTLKLDNENLKNEFCKERAFREDEDKKNEKLRCILSDRQNKLRCLNNDYLCMKDAHEKMTNERNMYQMENDKLKEHINILTKQNQDLNNEIDNVLREDEHMKDVLNRNERMSAMLKNNEEIICQMPQDLLTMSACYDENRNMMCPENKLSLSPSSMARERSYSPKYTYNRTEQKL
jgi:chromosome segregation ATPase